MDRGTIGSPLGIPLYPLGVHTRNTVQFNVRDEDLGERAPTDQAQPMTLAPIIPQRISRSKAQTLGVEHQWFPNL